MYAMCKIGELAERFEDRLFSFEYKLVNKVAKIDEIGIQPPEKQFDGHKVHFRDVMQYLLDHNGKFFPEAKEESLASKL